MTKDAQIIQVNREKFLRKIAEVTPGLSQTDILEQSGSICMERGRLYTFNQEVACRTRSGLPEEITASVPADKFRAMLTRLRDETLGFEFAEEKLVLHGKGHRTWFAIENSVELPLDKIPRPGKDEWKKLHKDFTDAVGMVGECASKDKSAYLITCLHVTPDFVEAHDNAQITRYAIKTKVEKSFLVKHKNFRHVPQYDFTHFAETGEWFHLKAKTGLIMSVARDTKQEKAYQDLSPLLNGNGKRIVLPKSLGKTAKDCEEFSSENKDDNLVLVEIKNGWLKVTGEAASGGHFARKKVKWGGKPLRFRVPPQLLVELLDRHTEAEIADRRLKIDGGKFAYAVCMEDA